MNADEEAVVEKLKVYFEKRADVRMAFLFGSRAGGRARARSDWDIGVYFARGQNEAEKEIWADVERITAREVDLVVLNRAPASISWSIVRGEPLVVKDRNVYLDFLVSVSHEANDWYRTAEDYHRVFSRSASLSREDRLRLEKIIQFFEIEISDFGRFESMTWNDYVQDRSKKREVERWAEQIVNAIIDSAEILLASERRVIPETYMEIVKNLGTVPPFDKDDLCQKLSRWTTLRNILAHEYLDYRWNNISVFTKEAKPELLTFISRIKEFLKENN